jgi:predicted nucleic acid-binding protein
MILVDTGPLVALFDPQEEQHIRCRGTLKDIRDSMSRPSQRSPRRSMFSGRTASALTD